LASRRTSHGEGVTISGDTKTYNGLEIDGVGSVTGLDISYHFCATCGSPVFWNVTGHPVLGVAVGNFVDPDLPAPTMETSTGMRHRWVSPMPSAEQFETYPATPDGW